MAGALACVGVALFATGCATVTVIESEAGAAPSAEQRSLREACVRALSEARQAGWGEAPGGSLTDLLRNGRTNDGPEDGVAAYFAVKGAGLSTEALRGALIGDLASASRNAGALADLGEAVLARSSLEAPDTRDLQEAERALILFKRGETLFSAAAARLETQGPAAANAAVRARLEAYGEDVRRLAQTVDALAARHMEAADAVS